MTTKYNIYFNGNEAFKEGLDAMENTHNEEFSQRIQLHPVYKLIDAKEPQSNAQFDRAIEKCKIAVQRRSITNKPKRHGRNTPEYKLWLTHSEFNPFMHNAWVLSGKAQFYKGDFNAAAATFSYTARRFWWLKYTVAECHIWAARVYAVQGFNFDAEAELGLVINPKQYNSQKELSALAVYKDLPISLQKAFSLAQAEILLCKPETSVEAIDYLRVGRSAAYSRAQKLRCDYLLAQLLEERGDYQEAYKIFGRLGHSGDDYKTQFNAKLAQINVLSKMGGTTDKNLAKIEKKFNRMRHQYRNEEYLDQIYYGLGNVALLQKDTTKAIMQFETALEESTRNGMDKAVAALRLGEITFIQEDYVKAQKAYSTAMGIITQDFKGYKEIQHLSSVLDELQTHAETVQLQDSLLKLSVLPKEELDEVIEKIIKDLIKAEKEAEDEERLAEYEANKSTNADPLATNDEQPTVGKQDKSWYFYNPAQVAKGKTSFQRTWGARKPEDDWRRKNKTETALFEEETEDEAASGEQLAEGMPADSIASDESANAPVEGEEKTDGDHEEESEDDEAANDPHKPEYYLAQIPFTDEQKQTANELIEEGLYNEGVIINEKLENFPLAIKTFRELETRYPESSHRPDMYYAIYLMYMRMSDIAQRKGDLTRQSKMLAEAEIWRHKLMDYYPESAYGVAVSDPNYIETLRQMAAGQDSLYIHTYEEYLAGNTSLVHDNYNYVHEKWPLSKLMPKFLFLHALSFVQDGDSKSFKEALEQLTATYPESDVSPLASLMIKGYREGRELQLGSKVRSMMWGTSLKRGDGSDGTIDESKQFLDDDNVPHVLLLAFKTDSLTNIQNDLLFEIAKFNFENYLVKDFDLEIIDTGNGLSVLVISGFDDLDELLDYHDRMDNSESFKLPDGITQIDISDPNFRLLLGGKTFEEYFDWVQATYPPEGSEGGDEAAEEGTETVEIPAVTAGEAGAPIEPGNEAAEPEAETTGSPAEPAEKATEPIEGASEPAASAVPVAEPVESAAEPATEPTESAEKPIVPETETSEQENE